MRSLIRALLLAAALTVALTPWPAAAQVPADARWQTIQSTHYRVTYHDGLEEVARRAIVTAERAHAALATLVATPPAGMIDIVVTDNVDFSNGYAMPFPANRVVIYAKPPVDVLELQYVADWIELVVIHEIAHIFHMDVTGGLGRVLRAVFGRAPGPWPVFPAVATPRWSLEGLAVAVESGLTDYGRLHGSYHEMVVRTAALAGALDDFDRLGAHTYVWPGPGRVYIYGSLFMEYLAREYGADVLARIVDATATALIPPPLWFGRVARRVIGVSFREAYETWQRELEAQYAALAAGLTAQGLTAGEPLTTHRAFAWHPRYSPDGSSIAYAANDQREPTRTRVIDATTGAEQWSRRTNDLAPAAWLDERTVLTSDIDFVDRFRIYSDLHVADAGGRSRITRGARLQDVHVARGGARAVAVENGSGTNRLVLVDPATGVLRAITDFDAHVHWALPRFSPAADRIAVGRWRTGGFYDVVVLDTLGRTLIQVTGEHGINAAPAWSPDGRWLLFWSDRTGIPNLYAAEIGMMGGDAAGGPIATAPLRPRLRQVTNVLTGAYFPDVSPDGRWIAYAAYRHDGFRLERLPFDTAAWREPMPAAHGGLATGRGEHVHGPADEQFIAQVRAAAAAADTTWHGPMPYRALRHARPYGWVPWLEDGGRSGDFFGFWTYGSDLVERHSWDASLTVAPRTGRTQGALSYSFRGLPAGVVHPVLSVTLDRGWETTFSDAANRFIDQREDRAVAALSLTSVRWRRSAGIGASAELVSRRRDFEGFAADDPLFRILEDDDRLRGARVSTFFSSFVRPAFAISPENGVSISLAARRRWDPDPRTLQVEQGTLRRDLSYREATGWSASYLALPLPGFARHVLAARVSGLYREGPGAGLSGIGGSSADVALFSDFLSDVVGSPRLLPVRGFPLDARLGNRAWTASAEYRAPLAMINRALRPLPIYADRLGASLFADAGNAWCDDAAASRFSTACEGTAPDAPPLIGAGAELTAFLSLWGAPVPLRLGVAFPLQGPGDQPRVHLLTGIAF